MYFLKSKYTSAPSTTLYKLIFPLNLKRLCYNRDSFSEEKLQSHCTKSEFNQIIDEIEKELMFFRKFIVYKLISIFSFIILCLFEVIGTILIIYDAVINKHKTEEEFNNLQDSPKQQLITNNISDLTKLMIIGIVVVAFGIVQFLFIIVLISIMAKKTLKKYEKKINKIFDFHNSKYKDKGIKFFAGEDCMWLEMRLDYKYDEFIERNPNSASWELIQGIGMEKFNEMYKGRRKSSDALEIDQINIKEESENLEKAIK